MILIIPNQIIMIIKENNSSDYRVNVIKGERMGIISSWDIEE